MISVDGPASVGIAAADADADADVIAIPIDAAASGVADEAADGAGFVAGSIVTGSCCLSLAYEQALRSSDATIRAVPTVCMGYLPGYARRRLSSRGKRHA